MTQTAMPHQAHTASSVESDLLYEVVDGHIVEKEPMGAYEVLVGSFSNRSAKSQCTLLGLTVSEM